MNKIDVDEFPVELRSRFLAAHVFAGADLGMWSLGENRELYYSTCTNEKEFWAILEISPCLDFIYGNGRKWDRPVILSDQIGMVWIAEHMLSAERILCLILMGPMFLSKTSVRYIEDSLREKVSSVYMRRQMMRTMSMVPVITLAMMNQYAKMLHYTLTAERILPADFIYQDERTWKLAGEEEGGTDSVLESDPERMMSREMLLLQAVTDGNMDYREIFEQRQDFESELISASGNTLRDAKNTILVFNALCCRAAIRGGMPIKTAKETELRYTAEVESVDTVTKLKRVNVKLLDEYVRGVHEGKANPMISKTIRESCDYIRANVTKSLSVEEIASQIGYTTYYFTKKFYKEMGIRVSDYIKQARVEYAKVALMTSKKSIQEISDLLQFGTRNYFSKVFHEVVGMTPAAYRERTGEKDGIEGGIAAEEGGRK